MWRTDAQFASCFDMIFGFITHNTLLEQMQKHAKSEQTYEDEHFMGFLEK